MDNTFDGAVPQDTSSAVSCAWRYSSDSPGDDATQVRWWCELTGQSWEERADEGWLSAVHAEDQQAVIAAWHSSQDNGEPYLAVFRVQTIGGEPHLILAYALPTSHEENEDLIWSGQLINITLYHRATAHAERISSLLGELGSKQSSNEIAELVSGCLRDSLEADAVAVVLSANGSETSSIRAATGFDEDARRILLSSPMQLLAKSAQLTLPGYETVRLANLTGTGRDDPGQIVVAFKDERWFSGVDKAFLDAVAQHASRAIQLTRATDAEREARAESDRAHHHLNLVADAAPALMAYVDRSYAFQFSNSAFVEWFDLPGPIAPGTSLETAVGSEIYEEMLPYLQRALAGEAASVEMSLQSRGLPARRIAYSLVPSAGLDQEAQGLAILGIDISERERAVERSNQLVELSAALSHASSHNEMVDIIVRQAPQSVGATSVAIVLAAAGQAMVWSGPWEDGSARHDLAEVPPEAPVWLVMEWNRPVFVHVPSKNADESSVLDLMPDADVPGVRVLLPMIVSLQPTGILVFAFPAGRQLSPSDIGFLQLLAGICAGAIDRGRLHDSLQDREGRFRHLAEALPQIVWVSSGDGSRLDYLNKRWEEHTGVARSGVESQDISLLTHPEDRGEESRRWRHSLQTGEPFEVEVRIRRSDGTYNWFLNRGVPIRSPSGDVESWFGTMTDIDSQRLALTYQGVIAALDTQVRLLSDSAQILQTLVTTVGRHLRVDRCFLTEVEDIDRAGSNGPQIAIRGLWVSSDYADAEEIRAKAPELSRQFAAELRTGKIVVVDDLTLDSPNERASEIAGKIGVRALAIVPFLRAGRWVAGITLHSLVPRKWTELEISIVEAAVKRTWPLVERSRAVEALAESENQLRHASEAANLSTFDFNLRTGDGNWSTDINRVLRRKNALAPPTSLDQLAEMIHEDDRQRLLDLMAETCAPDASPVVSGEFRHVADDGEICWFLLRGSVQFSGEGENRAAERVRGVLMDITARKREEEERLIALDAAAHDLKNPVATIRALAQVGMRRQDRTESPDPQLSEILESIEIATDRLTWVINDLIDTAHLRAGRSLPLQRREFDLADLLHECAESWRESHPDRDLQEDYRVDNMVGCWDEPRLQRVIDNLVGNAIKFSPDGGPVRITLSATTVSGRRFATVAIDDRGIGIASKDMARVQGTFERGSNVPDTIPGTGLGLIAARLITEQHGGSLELESTEGEGTRVTVHLPVEECPDSTQQGA